MNKSKLEIGDYYVACSSINLSTSALYFKTHGDFYSQLGVNAAKT